MAGNTGVEAKLNVNIDSYRKLVQTYINLHVYQSALFWADKVVALSNNNPRDIYWLAQCMFLMKQYNRASHLLRSKDLDKTYILCNYLTVKCLFEANELNEALKVLNSMDMEVFLQMTVTQSTLGAEFGCFDNTPQNQVRSSVLLLKGKILEAMDNRGLASDCYRQALQSDVYCFEAFESLIQHQMLTAAEEQDLLNSLPIIQQCTTDEAEVLTVLYKSKLKKYQEPSTKLLTEHKKQANFNPTSVSSFFSTPHPGSISSVASTPQTTSTPDVANKAEPPKNDSKDAKNANEIMQVEISPAVVRLHKSLDMLVADAEQLYYNCDYQQCSILTEKILKQDPYHSSCLPIHISCQVELKQSNKLFTLGHKLVDLYPNLAISWYAVGCYYYVIGKSDCARRYLAKATSLDRLFGPAWLAYGHSFAIENEHDQAMAAYFKASQLMRGCHLPLLYIGLECGLTNNIPLATKFFEQSITIAPTDPFVLHEMGVVAFLTLKYDVAEKHFRAALKIVKDSGYQNVFPERWAPLLNNLGHCLRKQKKYQEALDCHQEALVLSPQTPSTFSAIAFVNALMQNLTEAASWFHRALGLRRDDTFSTTMLNYVLEHLSEDVTPYPGAPDQIPDFVRKPKEDSNVSQKTIEESSATVGESSTQNEGTDMSMSMSIES